MSDTSGIDQLPVREIADGIRSGKWSAERVTRCFLDNVEKLDLNVRAWRNFDPEIALKQAAAIDANKDNRPLLGVPMGVKDVFVTHDLPTEYGSPIYAGNREASDAACVALARSAGAIVLGKTVTTEFATLHPGETRNPHDTARTPGGSSSGSVAAVGAAMVPLAYGTQTAGSTIRPASYCGIIGYKPTFGAIPRAGLKLVAESLDTVGLFGKRVDDVGLFAEGSAGRPFLNPAPLSGAPRLAVCRTKEWEAAEASTLERLSDVARQLRELGATVEDVALPPEFDGLADAQWDVMCFEGYRALTHERMNFPDKCSVDLHKLFETARATPFEKYETALQTIARCRALFEQFMADKGYDAVLTPAAPGEAPLGLESTGNPIINRPWTALYVPCITLPLMKGPAGMPIGVQFAGRLHGDSRLFQVAGWVEGKLLR